MMDIFEYTYRYPYAFLLIVPLLLFFYRAIQIENTKSSLMMSDVSKFKAWKNKGRAAFVPLNHALLFLSLLSLITALARPQTADSRMKRTVDGLDIVVVLDISDSMLIEDMKPENRLEAAKQTIRDFIAKRSSDRIGVVIFAGEAFTLVPPTLDYQLIMERINEIKTAAEARIKDGTAIGVGMATGAARLKDSQAKSRVLIFLTDGENNSGTISPEEGLQIAKGYDIKIYSIGLGKSGATRLPVYRRDSFGNKYKDYQPFESNVNDELLTLMATSTGGKYFRAVKEDSLQGVFDEINQLETTKIEESKYTLYNEFFEVFAFLGLALFALNRLLAMTYLRRGPL